MGYAFSGPDHAVAVWYELATKRYAPTAVNPVAIVGRVYAACCASRTCRAASWDLSVVVNELDPQVGFAYGFYIVRGLGYPRTADALNEMGVAWPARCDEWSVRAVRTAVKRGRQALEASLEERGWLATGRSAVSLAS